MVYFLRLFASAFDLPGHLDQSVDSYVRNINFGGLDGKLHKLSEYAGKPAIFCFWEMGINLSVIDISSLNDFAGLYAGKVNVIGIGSDQKSSVKEFVNDNRLQNLTFLFDTPYRVAYTYYRVHTLPTTIIFDNQGKSIQRFADYQSPPSFMHPDFLRYMGKVLEGKGAY